MSRRDGNDSATTRRLLDDLALPPATAASGSPRRWRWLGWAGPGVVLVLVLAMAWWFAAHGEPAAATDPVVAAGSSPHDQATPPARAAGSPGVLQASGFVVARRQATVSADVTGRLTAIHVNEGDRVKAGELLAEIDPRIVEAQARIARAGIEAAERAASVTRLRLAEARQRLDRFRELAQSRYISHAELDRAASEVAILEAQLASEMQAVQVAERRLGLERQRLASTRILAPFDGVVTGMAAHVGEIVSPISAGGGFTRTGICTIVDLESIEADVSISEQHLGRVREGQRVTIRAAAYPQQTFAGEVIGITPVVERNAAAVNVRVGFDSVDRRVMPGMRIDLDFERLGEPVASSEGGFEHGG